MARDQDVLGIGMVGYAFMGRAHSQAWRNLASFFELPYRPRMAAICGRDRGAVAAAAARLGWPATETNWKRLVERDDVDLVDVCTPGSSHAEISIAALEAGKHVLCEKPLANSVAEARAMAAAAERAAAGGVRAMVGFNFRRVPAVALARQLIAAGRLGPLRHVRGAYLGGHALDPELPLIWRLQADQAGSGALGDLGAHVIDLAQYLAGDRIAGVSALTETFVRERPLPGGGGGRGPVDVDDAAAFIGRFDGGALGSFEATRVAAGHTEGLSVEVNGALGSVVWELGAFNELRLFEAAGEEATQGSGRSRSPGPTTPTPGHGGRTGTASATSTPSPTRCATSSRRSPTAATRSRPSPTGSRCRRCSKRRSAAPRRAPDGRRSARDPEVR